MIEIKNRNFSIEQICHSGQCFRIEPIKEREYRIIACHKVLYARQEAGCVLLSCQENEYEKIWKNYFDMDTDYQSYINVIDKEDVYLSEAATYGQGIRILRQDCWEMIISFIISQQNNIKRIRGCIDALCRKYGKQIQTETNEVLFDFPTPEELCKATEEDLRDMKLGYRSRYIVETTKTIVGGTLLSQLQQSNYTEAKELLLDLSGIGIKVAECICLFGLHHLEAFPVDTHILKILKEEYNDRFPFHLYQGFEGVMQQYMFFKDLKIK